MGKLLYNYHTHTYRCGHASGKEEDYVLAAIQLGIKRLGFSDHIILPQGYEQPGTRGSYDVLDDYLKTIKSLKEKYKDKIDIIVGFEAEYMPLFLDYYKKLLKEDIDYLILGQHCYYDNGFRWYPHDNITSKGVKLYVDHILEGLRTGLFKYLVHPDLFMAAYSIWTEDIEKEARRLLKGCEELNIPIEINIYGMNKPGYDGYHHSYPNKHFFSLVKDYHLKVVLGIDAHQESIFKEENIEKALEFAKEMGIEVDLDYKI